VSSNVAGGVFLGVEGSRVVDASVLVSALVFFWSLLSGG
jgi:hypothetical protein